MDVDETPLENEERKAGSLNFLSCKDQFKVQRLLEPCEGNLQTHVGTQTESMQKTADVETQTATEPTSNLQSCNASCNCQRKVLENQEMIKDLLDAILKNQQPTTNPC